MKVVMNLDALIDIELLDNENIPELAQYLSYLAICLASGSACSSPADRLSYPLAEAIIRLRKQK